MRGEQWPLATARPAFGCACGCSLALQLAVWHSQHRRLACSPRRPPASRYLHAADAPEALQVSPDRSSVCPPAVGVGDCSSLAGLGEWVLLFVTQPDDLANARRCLGVGVLPKCNATSRWIIYFWIRVCEAYSTTPPLRCLRSPLDPKLSAQHFLPARPSLTLLFHQC